VFFCQRFCISNSEGIILKQINQFIAFSKAIFKFAFSLFAAIINFFFPDAINKQEVCDPLSKNLPQVSWSQLDETTDEGVKVVSKDGFIDY